MQEPPADVLAWVASQLDAPVVNAVSMTGGIDAHIFRLSLDGRPDVVLRITRGDWDDVDDLARILGYLADTAVPAPRVLAVDRKVGDGGHPALVQTLLEGDVSLPTAPSEQWLSALATMICAVQQVPLVGWLSDRAAARWAQLAPGELGDVSAADAAVVEVLRGRHEAVPVTPAFVHDDYWIGNTLRDGERVVGVVDWAQAGLGSAARDATYCAVDMSLCYGLDVGDRFMASFRERVQVPDAEVLAWHARAVVMTRHYRSWLSGWNALGVPVTREVASERRAELLDRVRSRLR